jgi:UDP-N-acetylmuramate--alanine ligase
VQFSVGLGEKTLRDVRVGTLVGAHMALNAAAALSVAQEYGLDLEKVRQAWASFGGVKRRFEFRGEAAGVRVYDDYAHHPTELSATLTAARAVAGNGRVVAVFQPGTYSRTQTFAREFAEAMGKADVAVVMDIFPAREEPIPGVTGALISEQVPLAADVVLYEPHYSQTPEAVARLVKQGDVVVTMGIGNVHLLCPEIVLSINEAAIGKSSADRR